jgi:hypothetical protein
MVPRGRRGAGARRQEQQVGEIAIEMLLVRRHGGVAGQAARRRVIRHREVAEEERLAAPVDHLRDDERPAQREGADVFAPLKKRLFHTRIPLERHLLLQTG